jgi:hypothetical protein
VDATRILDLTFAAAFADLPQALRLRYCSATAQLARDAAGGIATYYTPTSLATTIKATAQKGPVKVEERPITAHRTTAQINNMAGWSMRACLRETFFLRRIETEIGLNRSEHTTPTCGGIH